MELDFADFRGQYSDEKYQADLVQLPDGEALIFQFV